MRFPEQKEPQANRLDAIFHNTLYYAGSDLSTPLLILFSRPMEKTAAVIDLKTHKALWEDIEDIEDVMVSRSRQRERSVVE